MNPLFENMLLEANTNHLDWRSFDPASLGSARLSHYRNETLRILREEFGEAETIVLKEPRICRFVPFFVSILEDLGYDIKIVHITRNPLEVAASLEARNGLTPAIGQLVWLRHVLDAEIATRGRSRVFTTYEALLADWKNVVQEISRSANIKRLPDASTELQVDAFLNVAHRHHEASRDELETSKEVTVWVRDAYFALSKLGENCEDDQSKQTLDAIRSGLNVSEINLGEPITSDFFEHLKKADEKYDSLSGENQTLIMEHAIVKKDLQDTKQQLADTRSSPKKAFRDKLVFRLLTYLSTKNPPFSSKRVERFAMSASKRDPKRSIGGSIHRPNADEKALIASQTGTPFDAGKKTIMIVTHECSRTGAPILTLNLIQYFSQKYNVVCLALGGGELIEHFSMASTAFYLEPRNGTTTRRMKGIVGEIVGRHSPIFVIVNSIESRIVLEPLHSHRMRVVTLIHEFASYVRPRSALSDALKYSGHMVFSAKITLNNALAESSIVVGSNISVLPQGKCVVPPRFGDNAEKATEKSWLQQNLRPPNEIDDKFLVIGVGSVEYRKGVDLFIECINNIKKRANGDRFRFVWIGGGFDKEHDPGYSVYLDDQMKRAGVESQLSFLRPTSEIEVAYDAADVLMLSSRLDPLPNVAIDALSRGLPVVCFAETTGIADSLIESGLGQECVATYLDTNDMAQKVIALADAPDLYARVADQSLSMASKYFDMENYVSKLEAIALQSLDGDDLAGDEVQTIPAR